MDPWWSEAVGTYIGAFGGAGIGVVCGTFGAVSGTLAARGQARGVILGIHATLLALSAATLVAGIVAVASGQPYHVWYPLVLVGGIPTLVLGFLLPTMRRRYDQAEQRRLEAEQIRRQPSA